MVIVRVINFLNCSKTHLWEWCQPRTVRPSSFDMLEPRAGPNKHLNLIIFHLITYADSLVNPMECLVQSKVLLLLWWWIYSCYHSPAVHSMGSHCISAVPLWALHGDSVCVRSIPKKGITIFKKPCKNEIVFKSNKQKTPKVRSWVLTE